MKTFFKGITFWFAKSFGFFDGIDSIITYLLFGAFILFIIYVIVYCIHEGAESSKKTKLMNNKKNKTWFVAVCQELVEGKPEIWINREELQYRLYLDDNSIVTYDLQDETIIVEKADPTFCILPDAKLEDLRRELFSIDKEKDTFANCDLVSLPNDNSDKPSFGVVIPREKLQEGQLSDILDALDEYSIKFFYVPVTSDRTYYKIYDMEEAFNIAKRTIKAVYADAVVYHLDYSKQNAQLRVLVYVKRKDVTTELLKRLRSVINDLNIGDNKKTILADGSIMR